MFKVANCSSQRQVRWTECVVPNKVAADLPATGMLRGLFFQKGSSRPCGTTIYCLADLEGNEVKTYEGNPVEVKLSPAISKLVPDPTALNLELQVGVNKAKFLVARTEGFGTHRMRFHLRAVCQGFVADLWATVWSWQDIVDLCGRITWSDQSNPDQYIASKGNRPQIVCHDGRFHLDYAVHWGVSDGFRIELPAEYYPDAMSFPFYGIWHPHWEAFEGEAEPNSADGYFMELRRLCVHSAQEGPVLALYPKWENNWFAIGRTPNGNGLETATYSEEFLRFTRKLSEPGNIWDQRELASPLNTGQTGDQVPFSLTKDYVLHASKDPRRIYQLRESTVDYLLRCHHNMEPNGQPVRFEDHPDLRTWHLAKFRAPGSTEGDLLGKVNSTDGGYSAFGRAFVDDEHRGDNYIAAVRHVTDDPLLEADLHDRTQMDLARAFRRNRWVPTPRASGRLFQSWAQAWWTTANEQTRSDLRQLSQDEFSLRETHLQTNTGLILRDSLGKVRPANVIATDPRVIQGGPAFVPWNDACLLVGMWHQMALWKSDGADPELAARMLKYWLEVAETILRYGTVQDPAGNIYPLNGVLWQPMGEPLSDSYYKFPRDGASFSDDAYDMLVGTPGWFNTMGWPTVVTGYLHVGSNQECLHIASMIYKQQNYATASPKTKEWMV